MARINGLYVLVTDESFDNSVETTNHPTEEGLPISDTIRRQPVSLSLSGKIVDTDNATAKEIEDKLKSLLNQGSLITYIGQAGTFTNMQMESFSASFTNKNFGGADFDMSLKEIRTAKTAYVKTTKLKDTLDNSNLKVGDYVKFLGGNVYVSSDAKKSSGHRSKQEAILTKISNESWSIHNFHIVSKNTKRPPGVYGWVDKSKVTAIESTVSSGTNGGKQLPEKGTSKFVYHYVKKGDTAYSVAKKYGVELETLKSLNPNTDLSFLALGDYLLISEG